jgi:hypothetical protein
MGWMKVHNKRYLKKRDGKRRRFNVSISSCRFHFPLLFFNEKKKKVFGVAGGKFIENAFREKIIII